MEKRRNSDEGSVEARDGRFRKSAVYDRAKYILYRPWVTRVKGRDWYDFVWYIAHQVPVRLSHLQERLRQSHFLAPETTLTQETLLLLLKNKIQQVDFELAQQDILPFIQDPMAISLWSMDFFIGLLSQLLFE